MNESVINGSQWYSQQAFRALNQALGRCIRHRHDYGAIFLLDSRYCNAPHIVNQLSKWVRPCVETYQSTTRALEDVGHFFSQLEQCPPGKKTIVIKEEKTPNRNAPKTLNVETSHNRPLKSFGTAKEVANISTKPKTKNRISVLKPRNRRRNNRQLEPMADSETKKNIDTVPLEKTEPQCREQSNVKDACCTGSSATEPSKSGCRGASYTIEV